MYRYLSMLLFLTALVVEASSRPGPRPLPLRFQTQTGHRAELPLLLAPLPTNELVTITNYVEITNFVTVTITNTAFTNQQSEIVPSQPPAITNTVLIAPLPESQPLSPALLMQYFRDRKGTNPVETAIVAPMGFTPPPVAVPSSSAIYEKK